MSKIVRFFVGICLLAVFPILLSADVVHHYTNVSIDPGHLLISQGTPGATVIASNGTIGLGRGGCGATLYDDCWMGGSSPLGGNASFFDRYWSQIYFSQDGFLTFDLGRASSQAYIALSQDHGPYPQEALEYRVWVSNDNLSFAELGATTPIRMFRGGWSADGEPTGDANGNGVLNDDYSALWSLGGEYRYLRISALSAGGGLDEPEIDAVMGIVPEPAAYQLLGIVVGLLGVLKLRRR